MKKLAAAVLAVLLAVMSVNALCGEAESGIFEGRWQDPAWGRAMLKIMRCDVMDVPEEEIWYDVELKWADSASAEMVWYMSAMLDPETGALTYTDGVKTYVTYGAGGEIAEEENQWDDAEGTISLSEGRLLWNDSRDGELSAGFRFERVPQSAPETEEILENYLLPAANAETGSAGASLKQAILARDILRFACDYTLWDADEEALRRNMQAAWEQLSEEERSRFRENLTESIVPLLEDAYGDYSTVEDLFEDAGIAQDMGFLAQDDEAWESWQRLLGHTPALGGGEG
ncbi:MAG: hypothetical protein IKE30_02795 [Clostridia bacterium]|nr:hypothetical protein [Clostridia bacterium]